MPFYNGKNGRWITTETGRHVFIEEGQTVEQALADAFDEEESPVSDTYEPEFDGDKIDLDAEHAEFEDKKHKENCLKSFRGIWDAPYAYIKNYFKEGFMKHETIDQNLEKIIFDRVKQKTVLRKNVDEYKFERWLLLQWFLC